MHSLLVKKALDAVNEELVRPSAADDPRADDEYNHPFGSKGTELDNPKYGSAAGPTLAQLALASVSHLRHLASTVTDPQQKALLVNHCRRVVQATQRVKTAGVEDPRYLPITISRLERIQEKLEKLPAMQEQMEMALDGDLSSIGDAIHYLKQLLPGTASAGPDEKFFANMKRAEVEMHEEPRILPPRDDMRRHLDQDVVDETNEGVAPEPDAQVQTFTPRASLLVRRKQ